MSIERVRKTAEKRGFLLVGLTGLEKWNYPSELNDWGKLENVRADGTFSSTEFDVEGHTWTDVSLEYELDPFDLADLYVAIAGFFASCADILRMLWDSFDKKKFRFNLDSVWIYIKTTAKTLGFDRSYCGVTLNTLSCAKTDWIHKAVDELLEPVRPDEEILDLENLSDDYKEYFDKIIKKSAELEKTITLDEAWNEIKGEYFLFSQGLYCSGWDLTHILVDERVLAPDMKDGYSDAAILNILKIWSQNVLGLDTSIFIRHNLNDTNT